MAWRNKQDDYEQCLGAAEAPLLILLLDPRLLQLGPLRSSLTPLLALSALFWVTPGQAGDLQRVCGMH